MGKLLASSVEDKMPPQQQDLRHETLDEGTVLSKKEIYYNGYFYDVTSWIPRHPGGQLINFYTSQGEDASQAIGQFHYRSIKRTLAIMGSLPKREASQEERDKLFSKRHQALSKDFEKLTLELVNEGAFKPSTSHLLYRLGELLVLYAISVYLLTSQSWWARVGGILVHAMFAGRCGWLQHEGGHNSLTGNSKLDKLLQSALLGFGMGFPATWWRSQHNRHHAMPQRLNHDVDLRTLPLIAFNKAVVKKRMDGKGFFVQHQSKLFLFPIAFLVAFFWKLYDHPRTIWQKRAYADLFFTAVHLYLHYRFSGFVPYLTMIWVAGMYMLLNFALSHTHLPVTNEPTHWIEYSLVHTIDIEPSWWCDWWMGYLNYQIEHHLWPTMPQFRNGSARERVKALAARHGIQHQTLSYWQALRKTFANLENVSKELNEI